MKKDKKNNGNSVDALTIDFLLCHRLFKVVKEESDFNKIKKVTLDIGEMSSMIPSYFEDCYIGAIKKEKIF